MSPDSAQKTSILGPRRVRFNPSLCEIVGEVRRREDFSEAEKKELYLTGFDMQKIRAGAKVITRYFRVKDKQSIVGLDQAFVSALSRASAYESYDDFLLFLGNNDLKLQQMASPLLQWCLTADSSGRGLERYCSQKQRTERTAFGTECRQAVVRLGQSSILADDLAKFYHEYTRGNVIYARLLGHADAIAAKDAVLQIEREHAAAQQLSRSNLVQRSRSSDHIAPAGKSSRIHRTSSFDRKSVVRAQGFGAAIADIANSPFQSITDLQRNATREAAPPQKSSPIDRRKLLITAKLQQSSSARIMVERLGQASPNRMGFF